METEEMMKRLRGAFLQELCDHVSALNHDLLNLEKMGEDESPDRPELYITLFRSAHTLKGASRSAGIGPIEDASHHLESILSHFRDTGNQPNKETFRVLFRAVDAIEEAGDILNADGDLSDAQISKVIPCLEKASVSLCPESHHDTGNIPGNAKEEVQKEKRPGSPAGKKVSSVPATILARKFKQAATGQQGPEKEPTEKKAAEKQEPEKTGSGKSAPEKSNPKKSSPTPKASNHSETVRVPAAKLDTMLAGSGQLLSFCDELNSHVAALRDLRDFVEGWKGDCWKSKSASPAERGDSKNLSDRLMSLESMTRELSKTFGESKSHLAKAASDLDQEIHRFRLFPFSDGCVALGRAVRDVGAATGKEVELRVTGGETELDRTVIETLTGPLLHLVRNAVDHGIESPEDRIASGKPERATIDVRAQLLGDRIEVVVEDDGKGIDEEKIRASRSKSSGGEAVSGGDLLDLLAHPGFSTAQLITEISGRGVGLDAAKNGIEMIGGRMELASTLGEGTRFTLTVPLTITTQRVVLVVVGGQTFALPTIAVERMVRVDRETVQSLEGRELIKIDDAPVPVWALDSLLGLDDPAVESAPDGKVSIVILTAGSDLIGIAVDEFVDTRTVVMKKLGSRVKNLSLTAGATFLACGRVALVLNTGGLIRQARAGSGAKQSLRKTTEANDDDTKKRVVYSEDSPTTRSLVSSILASSGYEVISTVDGKAGWETLQQEGADIVVSDVDMPHMNGFEFAEAIRESRRFKDLPVILITSRATNDDKLRGMEAGANAYLVKGDFDQSSLLESMDLLLS